MPRLRFGVWQVRDRQAEAVVGHPIVDGFRLIASAQAFGNEAGVVRAVQASEVRRENSEILPSP